MRSEPPFSCPQCGDTGVGGDRCLRCKVDMLDRAGRPALVPSAVFLSLPESRRALVGDRHRRRRALGGRARLAAAAAVTPILQADEIARICGEISVIKAVKGPLGEPVAAYLVRARKDTVELLSMGRGQTRQAVTMQTVEESSACGTFVVRDESGAALIDDDAYALASPMLIDMAWDEPISIVLKDGAEVEILGAASRKPTSTYPDLAAFAGCREAPSILIFDGTPEQRVLLIASPRSGG